MSRLQTCIAALAAVLTTAAATASGPITPLGPEAVPGRALVKLRDTAGLTAGSDLVALLGNDSLAVTALAASAPTAPRISRGELLFPGYVGKTHEQLAERGGLEGADGSDAGSRERANRRAELSRWVLVETDELVDPEVLVEALRQHPDVELAEPDWLARYTFDPNDYVPATHGELDFIDAPEAWDLTLGSASQIIAILDTGVDWDHQDLATKIWANDDVPGDGNGDTCPGICGVDDDGDGLIDEDGNGIQKGQGGWNAAFAADDDENGLINDVRGWDFVNNDNDPNDDNGHGTHCAAIAAAATNNGLGRPGVCPNCRVMPVKTLSASGVGSFSNIAKAIDYAANNGATVISMSFTSVSASSLISTALDAAFPDAVLVAAAGNDGKDRGITPYYPAHYDNVVGVEASDNTGTLAGFSNFGYAVRAPGVDIRSALPDDGYATWSGTSMAAPVVAGIAGLVGSANPGWSPALVYGQLQQTAGSAAALQAVSTSPEPTFEILSTVIRDGVGTCPICDGDGRPDAGESFDVEITLRNAWSDAANVTAVLSASSPDVTFPDSAATFGSISALQQATNIADPLRATFEAAVVHGSSITLDLAITADGGLPEVHTIDLLAERRINRSGVVTGHEVWTTGNLYYLDGGFQVNATGSLTIQPGVSVLAKANLPLFRFFGPLVAIGTPAEPIRLAAETCFGASVLSGTTYDASGNYVSGSTIQFAEIQITPANGPGCQGASIGGGEIYLADNIFRGNGTGTNYVFSTQQRLVRNAFYDVNFNNLPSVALLDGVIHARDNTFLSVPKIYGDGGSSSPPNIHGNNFVGASSAWIATAGPPHDASGNYWGTTDLVEIEAMITDADDDPFGQPPQFPQVDPVPFLMAPNPDAPPFVDRIELSPVPPVGDEIVTFEIRFSRPMDPAFPPRVTFGPTVPYDQHVVEDNGIWLTPSIWQVEKLISVFVGGETATTNTIVVTGARSLTGGIRIADKDYRFSFVIDSSDSSTRSLSASGRVGGVDLTWAPADIVADIAGYHVYSSTSPSPTSGFTRINGSLVANCAELQCTYSDLNVTPGVPYYYFVRPATTDNLEGPRSIIAEGIPTDAIFPVITHSPIAQSPFGQIVTIAATISDNVAVLYAALRHRPAGSSGAYATIAMVNAIGNQYTANLAAQVMTAPGVEYYIEAADQTGNLAVHGSAAMPHTIVVLLPELLVDDFESGTLVNWQLGPL